MTPRKPSRCTSALSFANLKDAAAWLNLGLLQRDNEKKAEGDKDVLKPIALNPELKDPTKAVTGSDTVEAP